MGGKQIGFRFGHIGTAQKQFRRHAGLYRRRDDAVQILGLDVETFGRAAEQDRQRVTRFAFLFDQTGQAGFLSGDQRLFLGEVQIGGHAIGHLGLDHDQDALGGVDILAGDDDAFARRQHGEILLRHAGSDGETHHRFGIAGNAQIFARLIEAVPIQAPEIGLVAGGDAGIETVEGAPTR